VIFHYFAKFLRVHASLSEFLASARVFRTLAFDWAMYHQQKFIDVDECIDVITDIKQEQVS